MRSAGSFQFGEEPVQIERFGRSVHRRQHAPRQMILDGADQRGGLARGAQDGIDQIRCGGLAVGAGDAGESDALVGTAVEIARGQSQGLAAVFDFNPGRGEGFRRGRSRLATADAPRATASSANCRPSARLPGKAKKR